MSDSDPRQNAKIDNRKASNAQDLETQMTAVGSSPPEFINSTFRAEISIRIYEHDRCRLIECMNEGGGRHAMTQALHAKEVQIHKTYAVVANCYLVEYIFVLCRSVL